MGRGKGRLCGLAAGLVLLAGQARAEDSCNLTQVASVDMGIDDVGHMTVPMTVGGQTVTMLVDTGGIETMLSESVVNSLGLHKSRLFNMGIRMYGGTAIDHYVDAQDISFGQLKAPSMRFLVLPEVRALGGIGGMLAPDILRAYDDDFDFVHGKFSLFSQDHCKGKVVYWTKSPDVAKIEIEVDENGHIWLPVTIDGQVVHLCFDTGAEDTTMSLNLAEHLFGFDEKSPDLKVLDKHGDRAVYRYPFKVLTFGGDDIGKVTVLNPHIYLTTYAVSYMRDSEAGLIGMGILRQLHLYIAYKEHRLFITAASAH